MDEPKCVAGCRSFTGGEIKHYKSCPFYAESFTKMYDDLKLNYENYKIFVKEMIGTIEYDVVEKEWEKRNKI